MIEDYVFIADYCPENINREIGRWAKRGYVLLGPVNAIPYNTDSVRYFVTMKKTL